MLINIQEQRYNTSHIVNYWRNDDTVYIKKRLYTAMTSVIFSHFPLKMMQKTRFLN